MKHSIDWLRCCCCFVFFSGAVVHKLMRHKTSIISVAFTTDSNIAITGKISYSIDCFILIRFSASQDGLLSIWSTLTGIHLSAFHFNHPLVKLNVSRSGSMINSFKWFAIYMFFNYSSSTLCSHSTKYTFSCYAKSF